MTAHPGPEEPTASERGRTVHDLNNLASQLNLLLYNLRESPDDPEFRAEALSMLADLVRQVEEMAVRLKTPGEGASDPGAERG
ncbi:MAG: hypothetical protein QF819_10790 [Gemmatimonadota bacterium]|nr:hypothetical protein [Gemmatimonadota bacterium]MDP6529063.1 hypothetical protein [Gemmatimonadota bacterium]MDP6803636.1 hypothetical protein [Gemmatimonadota bacterium]MDP7030913.1 hypothetical protein [Gemmatimonadota bacterium]